MSATEEARELALYLRRVGFVNTDSDENQPLPAPTPETLVKLHQYHGRHVPFENLDQHCGRHIELDFGVLYRKIVQRGRGGFCFELNSLYSEMLQRLGFDVVLYSARVQSEGSWTSIKSHVVTLVTIHDARGEERWLTDVGYASCPHTPLRYDWLGVEQPGDGEWAGFRLTRVKGEFAGDNSEEECVMMERQSKADGRWLKAILIYTQALTPAELQPYCDAVQADEGTHLSKRILISAITTTERKTVSGAHRFITTTFADGQRTERDIMLLDEDKEDEREGEEVGVPPEGAGPTEKEKYLNVLQREFGISLTEDERQALDLEKSKRNANVW